MLTLFGGANPGVEVAETGESLRCRLIRQKFVMFRLSDDLLGWCRKCFVDCGTKNFERVCGVPIPATWHELGEADVGTSNHDNLGVRAPLSKWYPQLYVEYAHSWMGLYVIISTKDHLLGGMRIQEAILNWRSVLVWKNDVAEWWWLDSGSYPRRTECDRLMNYRYLSSFYAFKYIYIYTYPHQYPIQIPLSYLSDSSYINILINPTI